MSATVTATLRHYLVTHPTVSTFRWSPPETPFSSFQFLTLSVLAYLTLSLTLPYLSISLPSSVLRPISAAHSLFLTILSAVMAFGITLSTLSQMPSLSWPLCFPLKTSPSGPTFFWAYIFYLSKFLEFVDTLLIILGGKASIKRLSFLHVYHHAVVVIMCYVWLMTSQSLMPVALVTNAVVHTLMYGYYFCCALGKRPTWKRVVTDCQIAQFVFSFLVSIWMLWYHFSGEGCEGIWGWCFNAGFNGSLLYLFVDFHRKSYEEKKKRESKRE